MNSTIIWAGVWDCLNREAPSAGTHVTLLAACRANLILISPAMSHLTRRAVCPGTVKQNPLLPLKFLHRCFILTTGKSTDVGSSQRPRLKVLCIRSFPYYHITTLGCTLSWKTTIKWAFSCSLLRKSHGRDSEFFLEGLICKVLPQVTQEQLCGH